MWDIQDHQGILVHLAIVGKLELIRHPATQEDQVIVGIILEVQVIQATQDTQDTQASQVIVDTQVSQVILE